MQHIQKCSHVLASPSEGGELSSRTIHRRGLACLKRRIALVQVGQSSVNNHPLIGELAPSLRGFAFDVILQGVLSFQLVSHQGMAARCGTAGVV
jgi:hypothetical protein